MLIIDHPAVCKYNYYTKGPPNTRVIIPLYYIARWVITGDCQYGGTCGVGINIITCYTCRHIGRKEKTNTLAFQNVQMMNVCIQEISLSNIDLEFIN